jgi:hypothetical protein
VIAIRVTGMIAGCELDDLLPVFDVDEPPDDGDQTIETEADFDIAYLAGELRAWQRRGGTEEAFRAILRDEWPLYAECAFPEAMKTYVLEQEAQALIELGVAEPVDVGEIEDALECWGLA